MSETYGSASGTTRLYAVEARSTYSRPQIVCGHILTEEWSRIYFPKGAPVGVPSCTFHPISERYLDLHSFEAALALAHWFLTVPEQDKANSIVPMHPLCIEARLVEVELNYSYTTKEIGVAAPINMSDVKHGTKFEARQP